MRRTDRELESFLRSLAAHPERIPDEGSYGLDPDIYLFDHSRLYNRDGRPYAAIFHPYSRLDRDTLKVLLDWTLDVGLAMCVDADSEYYPGVTLRIVLHREGTAFPGDGGDVTAKDHGAKPLTPTERGHA